MKQTTPVDLVQQQRNRRSSGVRVRLQVGLYPGKWDVEYLGDALQNAQCGLVRNNHRDVFESQPVDAEDLQNTLGHRRCSLLENRFPVHRVVGVPGEDSELIHSLTLGEKNTGKEPILPFLPLQHYRTGAVSENNTVAV